MNEAPPKQTFKVGDRVYYRAQPRDTAGTLWFIEVLGPMTVVKVTPCRDAPDRPLLTVRLGWRFSGILMRDYDSEWFETEKMRNIALRGY